MVILDRTVRLPTYPQMGIRSCVVQTRSLKKVEGLSSIILLQAIEVDWFFEFDSVEICQISSSSREDSLNNVRTDLVRFELSLGVKDRCSQFLEDEIASHNLPWADLFVESASYSFLISSNMVNCSETSFIDESQFFVPIP